MRRVRFTTDLATASGSFERGQEVELPNAIADDWLKCGHVVDANDPTPAIEVEAAVVSAPETAVMPKPKSKRRK